MLTPTGCVLCFAIGLQGWLLSVQLFNGSIYVNIVILETVKIIENWSHNKHWLVKTATRFQVESYGRQDYNEAFYFKYVEKVVIEELFKWGVRSQSFSVNISCVTNTGWHNGKAWKLVSVSHDNGATDQKLSYCLAAQQNENTNFNFVSSICDINKLLVAESRWLEWLAWDAISLHSSIQT